MDDDFAVGLMRLVRGRRWHADARGVVRFGKEDTPAVNGRPALLRAAAARRRQRQMIAPARM
jgi:hypothetical protein